MRVEETQRGFRVLLEEKYQNKPGEFTRLIQESSAIGDYEDSLPGSSFLWVGDDHHLDREQVKELIEHMQYWLDNMRLNIDGAKERATS